MAAVTGDGRVGVAALFALSLALAAPATARAQESTRPTIEHRFGEKAQSVYGHATMMTQIRNDFYDSIGFGVDAGYYPGETLGLEARWLYLFSTLSPAAVGVKEETGLTPDARPQHMMMTLGARYSMGYGKMLIGARRLVHFDPQLVFHGGIALAEKRVLPTAKTGVSLLAHFRHGVQAKIDLLAAFQIEDRNRGWIPSFGFVPVVGIGWSGTFGELKRSVSPASKSESSGGGES